MEIEIYKHLNLHIVIGALIGLALEVVPSHLAAFEFTVLAKPAFNHIRANLLILAKAVVAVGPAVVDCSSHDIQFNWFDLFGARVADSAACLSEIAGVGVFCFQFFQGLVSDKVGFIIDSLDGAALLDVNVVLNENLPAIAHTDNQEISLSLVLIDLSGLVVSSYNVKFCEATSSVHIVSVFNWFDLSVKS